MSRKTKVITYNLSDRGRRHSGIDRSDVDVQSMVNQINSPATQEIVKTGDMFGYYGHEVRARFGMTPPDVFINPKSGENIRIEPALRTIKLEAGNNGDVSVQHEFLDNDTGNYSLKMYKNKVGGFSSAVHRRPGKAGKFEVTGFYGYDFLKSPNYTTNRGNGMFDSLFLEDEAVFDSIEGLTPQQIMIREALESAIASQYDSFQILSSANELVTHYQNEATAAIDEVAKFEARQQRAKERRLQREEDQYDALICPPIPFSKVMAQWDSFNSGDTSDADLRTAQSKAAKQQAVKRASRVSLVDRTRGF